MYTVDTLVVGAGLAGLSCSYHIGHGRCLILEGKPHAYGHIYSESLDGFTWDEGPHVSFTKNAYARDFLAESVNGEFEEYEVIVGNYFNGDWISHPAQSNLYQVPEPLRTKCLDSFLASRNELVNSSEPRDYKEWLCRSFGEVFAETFPSAYTRKYWTIEPERMTTEWVGGRVFQPSVDDVISGSRGPLDRQTHYVKKVRYPSRGGYQSYARKLFQGANIRLNAQVEKVDLKGKMLWCKDGTSYNYKKLISTIPLPSFINYCIDAPKELIDASQQLLCSSIQLVNVVAPHETLRRENWMYVYDEDKLSVRINCTEKLSPFNAPEGHTGVQVEVYYSRLKPMDLSVEEVEKRVINELIEMGIICPDRSGGREKITAHSRIVPWANVVFHHETVGALDMILQWLSSHGLQREADDLHPLTDWTHVGSHAGGDVILAGRFGQWKYYWSDDCLLRGKLVADGC
ncbi:MAG: FAD-dependent oxidoreductase [Verrucomicrobiota bacterium]